MSINLKTCDQTCHTCIKNYISKHKLLSGDTFDVTCKGIPQEYIPDSVLASLGGDARAAISMVDPVTWAAEFLDWHCLDPDGSVWKRKTEDGSLGAVVAFDPMEHAQRILDGKSAYHRPYQAAMLRCSSKYKVSRLGRQCLTDKALVKLVDGSGKSIKDIKIGDQVISFDVLGNHFESDIVIDTWSNEKKEVFSIKTQFGHEIQCSEDHPFLLKRGEKCSWVSLKNGLSLGDNIATLNTDIDSKKKLVWDLIVELRAETSKEITYDITVKKNHNFIANNIVAKNCGKTESLCVFAAWSMFTHENFAVEIIAPYQSQVDLIFNRLTEMIKSNATLSNSVARNVKAPNYQIKLKNGSYCIGFTAGTRSGQDAGAARGQHANLLIFDESDYLSPKDIDSALAMIINHPNATVWMSSTPTGRRERFFENCANKEYKEFHYPSHVNPNFTNAVDTYFKSQLTADGYKHEILGEFGEQEEGVYQVKYVEKAQENYEYGDFKPNPSWVYMIGVDWNDVKVGTTIAVIGFDAKSNIFYLVDKAIVSKGERTQLSACQKIAEFNRQWMPDFIYVDEGFGTTQIEVLHEYGLRALVEQGATSPDARLRFNVKSYDFGSTVEIHDIFTHQAVKKPSKPFLVENSVRRFETESFKYPKADTKFTEQLLGYIVQRVSLSGRPVYEAQNEKAGDHFLDAVNLALVAFTLEKSKFGKPTYSAIAAIAGRFGEKEDPNRRDEAKDRKQSLSKVAEQHKPKTGRSMMGKEADSLLKDPNGTMPGANMAAMPTKLWTWPGWGHDAPKPLVRTLTEAAKEAERRTFRSPHRRNRPSRSKF